MSKHPKQTLGTRTINAETAARSLTAEFEEIVHLIQIARQRALAAVNHELVALYWRIGEYVSRKLESAAWGEGVVEQLAVHIARNHPDLRGFTRRS